MSAMITNKGVTTALSALFLVTLVSASAAAQMLWVKPSTEITMRRGQGTDFKIVAVIKDGTPVELLNEQDEWAQIRLENGKDGWVLRRYLSDLPPLDQQLEALQQEKDALTQANLDLKQRYDDLSDEKEQIEQDLIAQRTHIEEQFNACIGDRDTINNQYTQLQADTTDVIKTKEELGEARTRIDSLEKELSRYKKENERLNDNQTLKWFLAGGGVLFLGWLIGLISRKSRKKRSSLL